MKGKHDVYVFQADDGAFKVRPGVSFARATGANAVVSFRNLTGFPISLTFDIGLMLEPNPQPIGTNPPNDTATFHIDPNADGFYGYQVKVDDGTGNLKMASGESDPGMIIDQ
jgi:hypothetical protein